MESDERMKIIRNRDELHREFFNSIAQVKGRRRLPPETHIYLSELMTDHVIPRPGRGRPGYHTPKAEAYAIQMMQGKFEDVLNKTARYERMRDIGDSLLFTIGFMPESLMPQARRCRPPLGYYAAAGKAAYSRAAETMFFRSIYEAVGERMYDLSEGFRNYAGVLFEVRRNMPGLRFSEQRREEVMYEMRRLLDEAVTESELVEDDDPLSELIKTLGAKDIN